MTRDTDRHGWTVPTEGDDEYEITFDQFFTDLDSDVEIRDEEQFLDGYDAELGAKFFATDTGVVYIGDGNQWNELPLRTHNNRHEDGGADEIDVTGLSGTLQDPQEPITESVEDIVGALLLANGAITVSYDDANGKLTVGIDEAALSFFDGTDLTANVDATTATFDDMTTTEGFVTTSPSSGTDIANKDYVDSVAQGLDWQESVLAEQNDPPTSPTDGDRYLVGGTPTGSWDTHAGELTQYVTDTWEFYAPDEGTATFIEDEDLLKVYQGSWMPFGSAINHGSLTGLGNDDHTQYVLVDGSRALSGELTLSDGSTAASENWVNNNADVPNADYADEADAVDGYDIQKDGTDGSGIINLKTN